ncbi:nicotinate-nucleotide--dimethylbenzimidazole phosphoribosyltransferase [Nibrella viscosa]|uniref:Nicotinate-nucleotide--dimethylbenzimidazole phosphoribosyltransferase n=1 Tax=Nibrella viscosa TaxID=1084524 RepID=A0ABP8KRV5_9BACT
MAIPPVERSLTGAIRQKIDQKTKPTGSLGRLEDIATQIALIQQTLTPALSNPHILVFAGDHGLVAEGISAYPPEVTYQMVQNFMAGGAAINVFCKQNGLNLLICDVGVNGTFAENTQTFVKFKIRPGTRNMRFEPAMTRDECEAALDAGRTLVNGVAYRGCTIVGFGEMGIGNTSAASLLMHRLTGLPLDQCVGAGTGLDEAGVAHKTAILQEVATRYAGLTDLIDLLSAMGGLEIAALTGGMLQAAENGMVILVDGFISTAALLVAHALEPAILDYCIFCHQSDEAGHRRMLEYLNARPLLTLGMRLGEGSGAALAFPIIDSAVQMLIEMASFGQAGISQKG